MESQIGGGLNHAAARIQELSYDVQALSHHLHSSKLEYLGLVSASSSFCKEFAERQNVTVDFHSEHIPKDFIERNCVCFVRTLQEALQNAKKYSGSDHFQVRLQEQGDQIELSVNDSGVGFDPHAGGAWYELGLTSMEGADETGGWTALNRKPNLNRGQPFAPEGQYDREWNRQKRWYKRVSFDM